jgi:hypothetical protein
VAASKNKQITVALANTSDTRLFEKTGTKKNEIKTRQNSM